MVPGGTTEPNSPAPPVDHLLARQPSLNEVVAQVHATVTQTGVLVVEVIEVRARVSLDRGVSRFGVLQRLTATLRGPQSAFDFETSSITEADVRAPRSTSEVSSSRRL